MGKVRKEKYDRHCMLTQPYELSLFKKRCKDFKCTVNSAFLAILGQTIKHYSIARGEEIEGDIYMAQAMSFK